MTVNEARLGDGHLFFFCSFCIYSLLLLNLNEDTRSIASEDPR